MRPGSLVARFRKCGKSFCHCSKKGSKGHGPSYSLTRPVAGKTVTRIIPTGPAVQQLLNVSEQICDWQLRHAKPETEGVKKNLTRWPPHR